MLPISELVRVARTLDGDGSSRLALRAAEHWGYRRARFVRSSANHVFFSNSNGGAGDSVLRLRPAGSGVLEDAHRIGDLAARIAAGGGPVASACASGEGTFAVEIGVGRARYVASMFLRIDGPVLDAASVTPAQAAAWGRGLARLHDAATRLDPPPSLPHWRELVQQATETLAGGLLADASAGVAQEVARLGTGGDSFGIVHGDPELDNVVWHVGTPRFVDLDDAAWSWFAADVAFALRDFAPPAGAPDTASQPSASFLAGYREIRPLTDEELTWLPVFGRAHALVTLARLQHTLDEPVDPQWPDWALELRRRIEGVAARLGAAFAA